MSLHLFRSIYRTNDSLLANLGKIYIVADTVLDRVGSAEQVKFYKSSEVEMRYMHDGVSRSFEAFEDKYGDFAASIWVDAIQS